MSELRAGAYGGLAFAAGSVVAGAVLPPPPAGDASVATVSRYFLDHHDRIVTASALSALAALALLPFLVTLAGRLGDGYLRRVATAGGSVLVTAGLLGGILQASTAVEAPRLAGSGALLAVFTVERAVFYVSPALAVGAVLVTVAAAGSRAELPSWVRAAGAVIGAAGVVGGVALMTSTSSGWAAVGFVGFIGTVLWVGATSTVLLRSLPRGAGVAAAVPA